MRILFLTLVLTFGALVPAWADIDKPATIGDTLDLLLERITPTFPQARIDPVNRNIVLEPDGGIINPDNIHAVLGNIEEAGAREEELDSFVATMMAAMTEPARETGDLPLERIYPVVRHEAFVTDNGPIGKAVYSEPFVGDMVRLYAIDYPDRVAYVTRNDLDAAGVGAGQLDANAWINFETKQAELRFDGNGVSSMALIDGFYESSLVLDGALWSAISTQMNDDIVMIVPARDLLIFTAASNTDEVAFLRDVRTDVLQNDTHQLSEFMYIWRDGAWAVLPE